MRIRLSEGRGAELPRFVVEADTDAERVVLKTIMYTAMENRLLLRLGAFSSSSETPGVSSFNFGFVADDATTCIVETGQYCSLHAGSIVVCHECGACFCERGNPGGCPHCDAREQKEAE